MIARRWRLIQLDAAEWIVIMRDGFPFLLGGQARARPGRESIGFIEADMRDRRGGIDLMPAG